MVFFVSPDHFDDVEVILEQKRNADDYKPGADLGGGCRGAHPPPRHIWDDVQLSNTTGILQKKYVVYWC